jgi:DNA-binding NarL/FixJ family response regulator
VRMVENIKSRRESQKILIYTSFDEDLYALSFIKSGANGFLSKHALEADFKVAVETILFQDKTYLSEKIKEQSFRLFIKSGKPGDDTTDSLTLREREIMQLFLAGKGISEVAGLLNLHTSTVSTHRIRIFNKMGVDNMIDLARKFEMLK